MVSAFSGNWQLTTEETSMSRLQRGLTGMNTGGGTNFSRLGGPSQISVGGQSNKSFEELKRLIHSKLVDKLDLSRVSDLAGDTLRREIRLVVERLCDTENPLLNRMERERLIDEVLDETFGFGPLEMLLDRKSTRLNSSHLGISYAVF